MAKQIVIVRINYEVHAKITSRPLGIVFALCDEKGTHLSLSKKEDGQRQVELSSDQPLGSVWDEARVGIARGFRWPRAERHANYVINRQYPLPAPFDPLMLARFCRPSPPPEQKGKYEGMPALKLSSRIPWDALDLSLSFRETVDSESAVSFPLGWAWLRLGIVQNDTEPVHPANPAPLGG